MGSFNAFQYSAANATKYWKALKEMEIGQNWVNKRLKRKKCEMNYKVT